MSIKIESPFKDSKEKDIDWKEYEEWEELFLATSNCTPDLPAFNQFPDTYPEGKTIVNRLLKERKTELREVEKKIEEVKKWTTRNIKRYTQLEMVTSINIALAVGTQKEDLEEDIKRLNKLKNYYSPKYKNSNHIKAEDVKDIPITDYIDFNNAGFACCLWHNEKTPSMKFYPQSNSVHCFGCGKSGDIIDVVQELHQCDFQAALKILKR